MPEKREIIKVIDEQDKEPIKKLPYNKWRKRIKKKTTLF